MSFIDEFKEVPISILDETILNREKELKEEYDRLIRESKNIKKKLDECSKCREQALEVINRKASLIPTLKLLDTVSEKGSFDSVLEKFNNLTIKDLIGDMDISSWLNNSPNTKLLDGYSNYKLIKDFQSYDATLKVMYKRKNQFDLFSVSFKYLKDNKIVDSKFMINDLINDFKKYKRIMDSHYEAIYSNSSENGD